MILSSVSRGKLKPSTLTDLTGKDLTAMVCFFTSGFVGLVYEICWIRKTSLIFGTTTFAVSTVVAVFFAGLALGSYIFGRYSQKTLRPLKVYALLEVILGVLALLNPVAFSWVEGLYGLFYASIMHSFALLSFIRFILTALLILPLAILMGGTLPLFCRQYVTSEKRISLSVGLLYGLNTLGAGFGCIVCGFYLIPHIGVNGTIWLGAVLNILIGLIMGRMQITATSSYKTDVKSNVRRCKDSYSSMSPFIPAHSTARDVFTISALFFLAGFAAMGNEILWIRYLSLIIHNTVYTYTLTLTVILAGIVLGSILICGFADRMHRRALIFGAVHVLTGISVLILLMLPAQWWKGVIDTQNFLTHLWIFVLLLLLPAILSGVSFPLAIRMTVEQPLLAGIGVGKMTAINTFGGIAGSLAVGFIVLPWLGLQKSLLLTTGTSLFIGFVAWFLLERTLRPLIRNAIVALGLFVWLSIPFVTGTRLPVDFFAAREKLVDFREGLSSNLTVIRKDDILQLMIDRMWQGESRKNHQIMAAHVPMLLHHAPRNILVIGLGVGQAAGRFLLYDVAQVECIDIERELLELVRNHFESAWMDDKRVRFIIEDGRNYLTHTNKKYDVISIEVGQIFRPGLASFYTTDFYRYAKDRLNSNGIVCQFVPLEFLGTDTFRSVIRSFQEVFPQSVIWYNSFEFLLMGSPADQLRFSFNRLDMLSSDDVIHKDLCFAYWGGPKYWLNRREVFLAGFLCGPESLAKLAAQAPVYRDDLPLLEYVAAKKQRMSPEPNIDLIRPYIDPIHLVLNEKLDDETLLRIQSIREQNLRDIIALSLYTSYLRQRDILLLQEAIRWNPYNVSINIALGNAFIDRGRIQKAISFYNTVLRIDPENPGAHRNMGEAMRKLGRYDKAIKHYRMEMRFESGSSPGVRNNLAWILAVYKKTEFYDPEEAIRLAEQACKLTDYEDPSVLDTLAVAYAAAGRFSDAVAIAEKALDLARSSEQKELAEEIQDRLRLYKVSQPYIEPPPKLSPD